MGFTIRCAVCSSCLTLLASPDSAGDDLGRARVVSRRNEVLFSSVFCQNNCPDTYRSVYPCVSISIHISQPSSWRCSFHSMSISRSQVENTPHESPNLTPSFLGMTRKIGTAVSRVLWAPTQPLTKTMSKISTLKNIDWAESRHPGESTYTAAAVAVYPGDRPQQQHRQEARQKKIEIPTLI